MKRLDSVVIAIKAGKLTLWDPARSFRIGCQYHPKIRRWALVEFNTKDPDGGKNPFNGYTLVPMKEIWKLEEQWSKAGTIHSAGVVCYISTQNLKAAKKALGLWTALHDSQTMEVSK